MPRRRGLSIDAIAAIRSAGFHVDLVPRPKTRPYNHAKAPTARQVFDRVLRGRRHPPL